jgi:nucleotide-binding universal stress UspA family protein
MKKILLPTDFSKNSLSAINYAMQLLKDVECEFYFLNIQKASSFVSDDLMTMSSSTTIYQTLIDTAKKSINNVINTVESHYNNDKHTFHSTVDYDNFIDAINQMCELKDIDLIIMGTKGATGAERVIFGSNTVRVMQRCGVPVLAIPNGCKFNGMQKLAFTTDYLSHYNEADLAILLGFVKQFNSKLDILHVKNAETLSQEKENVRAYLDELFTTISHEFVELNQEDIFKVVQDYIYNNQINMLAMTSKKYSFLERLFSRHNVEIFGFKIDVPFLVMEDTSY